MRNARFLISLLVASSVLLPGAVHAVGDDAAAMIARLENAQAPGNGEFDALSLAAMMSRLHVPAISVAVIKDGKLHWAKAYGVADAESGRPVDINTRFQSASIAKPVTALAAMRLAQAGQLDLDADVNSMLKSWQVPKSAHTRLQAVTPRSLFSHTSGADDGFGFPGYDPASPLPTVVQILEGRAPSNVGKVTFARAPYAAYKYSGGGMTVMQLALSELTGQPFSRFMQSTVLAPLKMTNSSFEQPHMVEDNPNAAFAHDKAGKRMGPPWRVHPEQAAAGLWSTPSDLAKFIIEVQSALRGPKGQVLDQRFAREMVTPLGVGPYGVGVMVQQHGPGWYFSHSGSNWGYRAWMSGHLRKGYGMVIMTNGDNGMALMNQVADRIVNAYGWDQEVKVPSPSKR